MFNCPSPTPYGPWVKLIPAVLLVREGQIFWEIPAGRAVLHWHGVFKEDFEESTGASSSCKPYLHQEPLSAGHRGASLCWVGKHRMVFLAACLPRVGLLSPSSPPYLTESVKMRWYLYFSDYYRQSLFICVRNSPKCSLLVVPNPLSELGSAHSSEHFVVDTGQGCHPSTGYWEGSL